MKAIPFFFLALISLFVEISALAEPSVTIDPEASNNALPLDGEGSASTHTVKIADISVSTTNISGYTLTITSGDITKVNGQDIAYQVVTVNDGDSSPTVFPIDSGQNYEVCTSIANVSADLLDVYIRYTPASLQDPGTYSETISITAIDNVGTCL